MTQDETDWLAVNQSRPGAVSMGDSSEPITLQLTDETYADECRCFLLNEGAKVSRPCDTHPCFLSRSTMKNLAGRGGIPHSLLPPLPPNLVRLFIYSMFDRPRSRLTIRTSASHRKSGRSSDHGIQLQIAVIESTLLVYEFDENHQQRCHKARAVFNVIVEDPYQNRSLVRFISDFVDFNQRVKRHFGRISVPLPRLVEPRVDKALPPRRWRCSKGGLRALWMGIHTLRRQKPNSEKVETYLKRCALDPDIGQSSLFRDFLRAQREEDQVVSKEMLESYMYQHLQNQQQADTTMHDHDREPDWLSGHPPEAMIPQQAISSLTPLSAMISIPSLRSIDASDITDRYGMNGDLPHVDDLEDDSLSHHDQDPEGLDHDTDSFGYHGQNPHKISVHDFLFIKVLGRGCTGKVLLVRHRRSSRLLALKAISKEWVITQREFEHARMERDILARIAEIRHPFLIHLHHSFQDASQLFLVLDYHVGGDLATQLSKHYQFHPERCRLYAAEILLGLQELHRLGIIYRDLKPENILLASDGHLVLTDFGLSKLIPEPDVTGARTNTFCGTAEYLAPEILRYEPYSFEVDLWSLGTILYEMLTGVTPYWSESHAEMYRRVLEDDLQFPEDFDLPTMDLICGLLNRDPDSRLGAGPDGPILIRSHSYFDSLDWADVYFKRIKPEYVPHLRSEVDVSHFDQDFLDMSPRLSPIKDGDVLSESLDKAFQGYSYTGGDEDSVYLGSSIIDGSMIIQTKETDQGSVQHTIHEHSLSDTDTDILAYTHDGHRHYSSRPHSYQDPPTPRPPANNTHPFYYRPSNIPAVDRYHAHDFDDDDDDDDDDNDRHDYSIH